MAKQFDGAACVLCRRHPSTPTGEHVWPRWFFKIFPPADGPYETWIGSSAVRDRDQRTRQHAGIPRVKLPVCRTCNGALDDRFEKLAKPILRKLIANSAQTILTAPEAMHCALWLLKTWLFLANPAAISSDPAITNRGWDGAPEDLWNWTVNGLSPPAGLSPWLNRPTAQPDAGVQPQHLMLPTIIVDGEDTVFRVQERGVQIGTSFVQGTVVFHPGWEVDHPLEAVGRSLRLWPRQTDESINLAALPPSAPNALRWVAKALRVTFAPGAYANAYPPALSSSPLDLMALVCQTGVTSVHLSES
jgi:hypothetical protein